jgi:hypothetical protein
MSPLGIPEVLRMEAAEVILDIFRTCLLTVSIVCLMFFFPAKTVHPHLLLYTCVPKMMTATSPTAHHTCRQSLLLTIVKRLHATHQQFKILGAPALL